MKSQFSFFILIIPTHLLCQIWANSPVVKFQRAMSNFRKRNISPSLVYLLIFIKREARHFHVMAMQWRQGNVQKSVMHVQSCFLLIKTYCYFDVLVVVASSDLKAWFSCVGKIPDGLGFYCFPIVPDFADEWKLQIIDIADGLRQSGTNLENRERFFFPDASQISAMVGDHFRQMKTQICIVGDVGDGIRSLPIL